MAGEPARWLFVSLVSSLIWALAWKQANGQSGTDADFLLAFKETAVVEDPTGVLNTWVRSSAKPPCDWRGVECDTQERAGGIAVVRALDLSNQDIKGTLWKQMGNLKFLRFLNLQGNRLSGPLIYELSQLYVLQVLDLSNNELTGEVPEDFGYLKYLTTLKLAGNKLEGGFPG
eukprot:c55291_g1_i1 orf=84-602(+)